MDKTLMIDLNEINPYVRQAGFQNQGDWPNKDRRLYDHEMFYCIEGRAHIIINGKYYKIKKGTIILIKPNTPTRFWFDKKNPARLCWIHFDFLYFDDDPHIDKYLNEKSHLLYSKNLPDSYLIRPQLIFKNGFAFPEYLIINSQQEMEKLCIDIIKAYNEQDLFWKYECKICLLQIFKLVLKQIYSETETTNHDKINVTENIVQYIKYNYYKKIKIEELSHYIGLSKDYIGKIFKSQTNKSIITYLNLYRIEKAKQLLQHSELSIKDISDTVGFNDQYYFSKAMKSTTGFSPLQWRKSKE